MYRYLSIAAVVLSEFFPQATHNGLLDGDRETGCFHSGRG